MTIPETQRETAAFLASLTGDADPRETHISAVFVGPDAAYKLKKAVTLSFLDFAPAAHRRDMVAREFALNRVGAPGLYRRIHGVVRTPSGLALAAEDTPGAVEHVLEMAPIPAADFLDAIAARGGLDDRLLDRIGDAVAALHAALKPVQGHESAAALRAIAAGNATAARAAGLPEGAVGAWLAAMRSAIDAAAPALAARAAAGFVRRCHGDLHLGNLCLFGGQVTAFDMLEFDEALAIIDTGYDLAFLLMDLARRAGRAAANRVLNRYVAISGDDGVLAAMPLFLSLRAMVRAHVRAAAGDGADAAAYLDVARDGLAPAGKILVAIGGLQGSGKSTLARALAPGLGRPPGALVIRSDEVRKRQHGVTPEHKLPAGAYDAGSNARVNTEVVAMARRALTAGHAVIADTTFLAAPFRHAIEAVARDTGAPFLGVWLDLDLEAAARRLRARSGDASDADEAVLRRAAGADPGPIAWHRIPADDGAAALAAIRARLPVHARSAVRGETSDLAAIETETPDGNPDVRA